MKTQVISSYKLPDFVETVQAFDADMSSWPSQYRHLHLFLGKKRFSTSNYNYYLFYGYTYFRIFKGINENS